MKRRKRQDWDRPKIVGVFGSSKGVGVTHLVWALASYTSQFLGVETTIMECCEQDEWIGVGIRMAEGEEMMDDFFRVNGIRVFVRAAEQCVAEQICINKGVVILDLGHDYMKARPYLLRCDSRILVGSAAPWKIENYLNLIHRINSYEEKLKFNIMAILSGVLIKKDDKKRLRNQVQAQPVEIPFIQNPFKVKFEHCEVFEMLLEE